MFSRNNMIVYAILTVGLNIWGIATGYDNGILDALWFVPAGLLLVGGAMAWRRQRAVPR